MWTMIRIVLLAIVILLSDLIVAIGHEWYENECCHDIHCGPVVRQDMTDGVWRVSTAMGTAIVNPDTRRRASKDGRVHACIRDGKLICLYLPPML